MDNLNFTMENLHLSNQFPYNQSQYITGDNSFDNSFDIIKNMNNMNISNSNSNYNINININDEIDMNNIEDVRNEYEKEENSREITHNCCEVPNRFSVSFSGSYDDEDYIYRRFYLENDDNNMLLTTPEEILPYFDTILTHTHDLALRYFINGIRALYCKTYYEIMEPTKLIEIYSNVDELTSYIKKDILQNRNINEFRSIYSNVDIDDTNNSFNPIGNNFIGLSIITYYIQHIYKVLEKSHFTVIRPALTSKLQCLYYNLCIISLNIISYENPYIPYLDLVCLENK